MRPLAGATAYQQPLILCKPLILYKGVPWKNHSVALSSQQPKARLSDAKDIAKELGEANQTVFTCMTKRQEAIDIHKQAKSQEAITLRHSLEQGDDNDSEEPSMNQVACRFLEMYPSDERSSSIVALLKKGGFTVVDDAETRATTAKEAAEQSRANLSKAIMTLQNQYAIAQALYLEHMEPYHKEFSYYVNRSNGTLNFFQRFIAFLFYPSLEVQYSKVNAKRTDLETLKNALTEVSKKHSTELVGIAQELPPLLSDDTQDAISRQATKA